jgi:purine-binding chemotaxis protein CheW
MLGVIHLRGSVVPIVDLRLRFNLGGAEYNAKTVIIVLTVEAANGLVEVGVVVDGVKEVVDVDASRLRPAPDLGGQQATEYVSGLLPSGDHMVVLLDLDRLIGAKIPESARAA